MSWSKLIDKPIGKFVLAHMDLNPALLYHNSEHIRRLYDHAITMGIPYNPDLDAAILFHDAIYDNGNKKEIRSARFMLEYGHYLPNYVNIYEAQRLILNTTKHKIMKSVSPNMIKLDLYELTNPILVDINFRDILKESMGLYNISMEKAAQGTYDFMVEFRRTMKYNIEVSGEQFWKDVLSGVEQTIELAREKIDE